MFIKLGGNILILNRAVIILIATAMLIMSSACERAEIVERYYSTYGQLEGEGEPGNWIPLFIPGSATEIKAKYKIDTGAEFLTFRLNESENISTAGHCVKVMENEVELPRPSLLRVNWWPDSLSRDANPSKALDQYEFFRCERQTFLAVEKHKNIYHHVFYWRIR